MTALGAVLVVGGIAMLVLPGPGIVVVVLGFAVLGTEYAWAAAAVERIKRTAQRAGSMAENAVRTAIRRRGHDAQEPGTGPGSCSC